MKSMIAVIVLLVGTWSAAVLGAGFDTQPEGPRIEVIQANGVEGATVAAGANNATAISTAASAGKPGAVFSLREMNINDRMGLAVDVKNTGSSPVRVYADLNDDRWVRGYVTAPAGGQTATIYVFARRRALSEADSEIFPGMHGIPGGKMSLWAGIEEPIMAKGLKIFLVTPREPITLEVSNIRPFGSSKLPDLTNFFPFIDKYGQYKHKEWPGKVHADADLKAVLEREDADLAANPRPADLNKYGGWAAGPQLRATGHFRVEKYEGKWWFVDPEGRLFWSNGLDCVGFNQSSTRIEDRENFYEDPAPNGNFLNRNLQIKYGDDWRSIVGQRLTQRLQSWGLNTIGNAADREIMQLQKVPYTVGLSSRGRGGRRGGPATTATTAGARGGRGRGAARGPTTAPTTAPATAPFNPESDAWTQTVRQSLTAAAALYKDDPWCIGFFVDNEIHPNVDPKWFETYYRKVSTIAREVMPNKLYLGSRLDFHNWPDDSPERHELVRNAATYCDVVSFNFYKFTLDDVVMPTGVDKPLIIGEFHMGALDRGQFHTGLRSVLDQQQRAEAYRYFVTSALNNPWVVGAHWFQCYDESATGRSDGENYQIGFLDICDTPYWETIAAIRDVGYRLYNIRAGK